MACCIDIEILSAHATLACSSVLPLSLCHVFLNWFSCAVFQELCQLRPQMPPPPPRWQFPIRRAARLLYETSNDKKAKQKAKLQTEQNTSTMRRRFLSGFLLMAEMSKIISISFSYTKILNNHAGEHCGFHRRK